MVRVLIIADAIFAARERSLLSRLEIGLADEGVGVVHALPDAGEEGTPPGEGQDVYARFVTYAGRTNALTRRIAVKNLRAALAQLFDNPVETLTGGHGLVDLVHVFGGNAWTFGAAVARELAVPLALEVWRPGLVERVSTLPLAEIPGVVALAPDRSIEEALGKALPRGGAAACRIVHAPWGVLCDDPREILRAGLAPAAVVVGSGRNVGAYGPMLAGLAPVAKLVPELMIFCDARAARNAEVWAHARRLGLLDRLSLVENLEARRDLVLQADVLVHPESQGEQRSVVLDAMAGCMVVIAARDPHVSALQEGRTALLVDATDASAWQLAFTRTFTNLGPDGAGGRARAVALGKSAHDFVKSDRTASAYIRAVLATYADHVGRLSEPM